MNQREDPEELERKIAQASRIANRVSDQTTIGRLLAWIEDLKQSLQRQREAAFQGRNPEAGAGPLGGRRTTRRA